MGDPVVGVLVLYIEDTEIQTYFRYDESVMLELQTVHNDCIYIVCQLLRQCNIIKSILGLPNVPNSGVRSLILVFE